MWQILNQVIICIFSLRQIAAGLVWRQHLMALLRDVLTKVTLKVVLLG